MLNLATYRFSTCSSNQFYLQVWHEFDFCFIRKIIHNSGNVYRICSKKFAAFGPHNNCSKFQQGWCELQWFLLSLQKEIENKKSKNNFLKSLFALISWMVEGIFFIIGLWVEGTSAVNLVPFGLDITELHRATYMWKSQLFFLSIYSQCCKHTAFLG